MPYKSKWKTWKAKQKVLGEPIIKSYQEAKKGFSKGFSGKPTTKSRRWNKKVKSIFPQFK